MAHVECDLSIIFPLRDLSSPTISEENLQGPESGVSTKLLCIQVVDVNTINLWSHGISFWFATHQVVKKKTKHSSNYREAFHWASVSSQLVTPAETPGSRDVNVNIMSPNINGFILPVGNAPNIWVKLKLSSRVNTSDWRIQYIQHIQHMRGFYSKGWASFCQGRSECSCVSWPSASVWRILQSKQCCDSPAPSVWSTSKRLQSGTAAGKPECLASPVKWPKNGDQKRSEQKFYSNMQWAVAVLG